MAASRRRVLDAMDVLGQPVRIEDLNDTVRAGIWDIDQPLSMVGEVS
jgi:hypothetical protein